MSSISTSNAQDEELLVTVPMSTINDEENRNEVEPLKPVADTEYTANTGDEEMGETEATVSVTHDAEQSEPEESTAFPAPTTSPNPKRKPTVPVSHPSFLPKSKKKLKAKQAKVQNDIKPRVDLKAIERWIAKFENIPIKPPEVYTALRQLRKYEKDIFNRKTPPKPSDDMNDIEHESAASDTRLSQSLIHQLRTLKLKLQASRVRVRMETDPLTGEKWVSASIQSFRKAKNVLEMSNRVTGPLHRTLAPLPSVLKNLRPRQEVMTPADYEASMDRDTATTEGMNMIAAETDDALKQAAELAEWNGRSEWINGQFREECGPMYGRNPNNWYVTPGLTDDEIRAERKPGGWLRGRLRPRGNRKYEIEEAEEVEDSEEEDDDDYQVP